MGRFPLFWMGVAALAAMTTVGCGGSEPGGGGDGGSGRAGSGGQGSGDGGAGGKTSSTTVPDDSSCATIAALRCGQMKSCMPHIFGSSFMDLGDCEAVGAAACAEAELGGATGFVDPDGCKAASLGGCDEYFGSDEVCAWKPGTKTAGESCKDSRQCGAGLYCDAVLCGRCVASADVGEPCSIDSSNGPKCDYRRTDVVCAEALDDPMDQRCRTVTLGAVGSTCDIRTELGCAAGSVCSGGECEAMLPLGAECDILDTCESPWSCVDEGGSTSVCGAPYHLVELGEECDASSARCRAGAYCNIKVSPKVCAPEGTKGAECKQFAACARGLQCKDGTCQDADPITCD